MERSNILFNTATKEEIKWDKKFNEKFYNESTLRLVLDNFKPENNALLQATINKALAYKHFEISCNSIDLSFEKKVWLDNFKKILSNNNKYEDFKKTYKGHEGGIETMSLNKFYKSFCTYCNSNPNDQVLAGAKNEFFKYIQKQLTSLLMEFNRIYKSEFIKKDKKENINV